MEIPEDYPVYGGCDSCEHQGEVCKVIPVVVWDKHGKMKGKKNGNSK